MRQILSYVIPPALIIFLSTTFIGCGYKEIQLEYYRTVQKQLELHYANQRQEPPNLVEIDAPDGYKVRVANPYYQETMVVVRQPDRHPAYGLVGAVLHSPVASILAGGYAGSLLMKEAGNKMVNSGNTSGGDMASSVGGDASINNSVTGSHNPDQSNNSINDSYNPDQSDNSFYDGSDNSFYDGSTSDSSSTDASSTDASSYSSTATDNSWRDNSDNSVHDQSDNRINLTDSYNTDNRFDYNNPDNRSGYNNTDNRFNYDNPDNRFNYNNTFSDPEITP